MTELPAGRLRVSAMSPEPLVLPVAPPAATLVQEQVRSAGNTVRNDGAVGATAVTLMATAVASAGIVAPPVQSPTPPVTCWTWTSPGPSGTDRVPTVFGAGR